MHDTYFFINRFIGQRYQRDNKRQIQEIKLQQNKTEKR
jgi:hypothetical protein